ncbi:MAG: hypothetical protein HYY44_00405 [Deltaproteobacteria bacterium]|nr:hypothetical protein [Deltaproteobacteria bacterium]
MGGSVFLLKNLLRSNRSSRNRCYSESSMAPTPDFVKLAASYGGGGFLAKKPSEVEPVLKESMKVKDRPVLIDFQVAREENVMPMVPAGKGLDEMLLA